MRGRRLIILLKLKGEMVMRIDYFSNYSLSRDVAQEDAEKGGLHS